MRLRRLDAGAYLYVPREAAGLHYRIERGWAEAPGTDRRRESWVLVSIRPRTRAFAADGMPDEYDVEILTDHPTLAAARAELERLLQAATR